jgi:DNA sulfur modification protein DndE
MVWGLGRIYSSVTPGDYKAVHALHDRFSVVPLSAHCKPCAPPPGVVNPEFDMKTWRTL